MRGRLAAGLLALGLLCALTGCGGPEPQPTETPPVTAAPTPEPAAAEFALPCYAQAGFHPITGANRTNLALSGLLYEGLFELDGSFAPQKLLCGEYSVSEDGLTWRFILYSGVTFSDGSALTAADAVYSLNLARGSDLYRARLSGVRSVSAENGAVVVTLSAPNGALPALLDIPIIRETGGAPLGTGPYVLEDSGDTLRLTARTDWWRRRALPVDVIPLRNMQTADDLIHAFDTREVALVSTDLTGTNALGFSGAFETTDYPTSVMLYVGFNCADGPCKTPAVRQALQRCMDRGSIATALLSRHAQAAALPVSPVSGLYDHALAQGLDYAPQAAAELLEGAGWSLADGVYTRRHETLSLTLVAAAGNPDKLAVAEYLAAALTQAGCATQLRILPWEDYLAALEGGDFDLYLGEVRMTADFDPAALITPEGALNYGGFADGESQVLLSAFQAAGGEARSAAARALYTRLAEQAPFAVLCFKNWSVLTQWNQATGLTPTQQNVFYGFAGWRVS